MAQVTFAGVATIPRTGPFFVAGLPRLTASCSTAAVVQAIARWCAEARTGAHFEMGENRLTKRRSRPIVDSHNEMTMVPGAWWYEYRYTTTLLLYYDCSTSTSTREVQVEVR